MFGSKDSKIVRKIVNMANHSKIGNEWEYDHGGIGYNYELTTSASLVTSQLKVIDEIILKKRKLHKFYNEYFDNRSKFIQRNS